MLQVGRRVPAVTVAIDAPERIAMPFSVIDQFTAGRDWSPARLCPPCEPGRSLLPSDATDVAGQIETEYPVGEHELLEPRDG